MIGYLFLGVRERLIQSVIKIQLYLLVMLASKTNSSCFSKKIKSPYVLQYLAFEERMNAPTKRKNPLIPNLLQPGSQGKPPVDDQNCRTFEQVKEFIKKRNKIWVEEKENMLPTIED